MAMAMDPMAQDVIRCDLCTGKPVPSPVDVVCNTCNINLCNECLAKHVSSKLSIKHDIVGFRFKSTDIPSISCQFHSNLKCDLQCRTCNSPVCAKCLLSDSHRNHEVIEIKEIFDLQKEAIKKDTEELENFIVPVYENMKSELQTRESKLPGGYDGMKKSILQQGKEWHNAVDIVIKKNLTKAEQMQKDDLALLRKLQSDMNDQLSKVRQTIEENKNFLKSNAGTKIMNYKSRNEEFSRIPPSFDLSPPTFVPMKIQGEQLNQMFGELKPSNKLEKKSYTIQTSQELSPSNKQFLNKLIVKNIKADSEISRLCCVPNTEQCFVKLLSKEIMKHLDRTGTEHETVKTKSGNTNYINLTVTRKGNLVYSDYKDRSINMVQHSKINTIIRLHGWKPESVCSTSSDDLLISMKTDDEKQSKVVRYNGSSVTQEIQFDDQIKPLYSGAPYFIAENKNLNVCVSDKHKVVVTDKAGKFLFRYNGNLSSKKYKTFNPFGLATDSMWHILVADYDNKCVHIINHEGRFIRYIDNCDLHCPQDVSVSSDDMLYIADCTSKVKMIKYLQ